MSYGLSRARSCGTFVPKFLANFTGLAASRLIPQEFLLILEETARLWMGSIIPRIFASASSVAVGTRLMEGEAGERTVAFLGDRRYDNVCSSTQDHPAVAMSCLCSSCGQVFSPTIIVPPSRSGVDILHRPLSQ